MSDRLQLGMLLTFWAAGAFTLPAAADEPAAGNWGSLTGRIVYNGEAPAAEPLEILRDQEFCGAHNLTDESLVVNPKNKGIRWVAVWLDSREPVPIHPDLLKPPEQVPTLDNRDCRFQPRMLAVPTGREFHISNSDPIAHNAAVFGRRNQPFSIIVAQNQPLTRTLTRPELLPLRVECSIHSWMRAWLVVTDHPYVAVTDENGRFTLTNVPAGDWKFHFWHERPGNLIEVSTNGQVQPLERGTWELQITPDTAIDLGDLLVDPAQFVVER